MNVLPGTTHDQNPWNWFRRLGDLLMRLPIRAPNVIRMAAAGVIICCHPGIAQEAVDLPKPQYHGTVYWFDGANNKLLALERQQPSSAAKMKGPLGIGGVKALSEVPGAKSPIRFTADQKPEFVFNAAQNIDPQTLAQIVTFTVKRDHRELLTAQSKGPLGMGGFKHERENGTVPFEASKYNDSSIKISPAAPLPPGEYAVRLHSGPVFCFGVDSPRP